MAQKLQKDQKTALIEFLNAHEQLRAGKFTAQYTHKRAQQEWSAITEILNAMPGGVKKEWKQWRRTWIDLKKNSKAKAADSKKQASKTGGGTCGPVLQEEDAAILAMLPNASVDGHKGVLETSVEHFDFTDVAEVPVETTEQECTVQTPGTSETPAITIESEHGYALQPPPSLAKSEVHKGPTTRLSATKLRTQSVQLTQRVGNILAEKKDIMAEYYARKMKFLDKQEQHFAQLIAQGNEVINLLKDLKQAIMEQYKRV